jgi:ComF family protein
MILETPMYTRPFASSGERLHSWLAAGLDLIFPPTCATCGRVGHLICPTCAQQAEPAPLAVCRRCGRVQAAPVERCAQCATVADPPLAQVHAAALHTSPVREFIHLLKYEQRPDLAPALGRYLAAALLRPEWDGLRDRFDAVAPVPLHAERLAERGYNQAELLARALSRRAHIPLRTDLIRRARHTRSQVGLNAHERADNVEDAFLASPACAGLNLLLVDDVYTTGATLTACATAARRANANLVCGLTLAMPLH